VGVGGVLRCWHLVDRERERGSERERASEGARARERERVDLVDGGLLTDGIHPDVQRALSLPHQCGVAV